MLELSGVAAAYGAVQVLRDVSLVVRPAQIVCLAGRNGAGKTTTLKAIMGQVTVRGGHIRLDGTDLAGLPAHRIPQCGLGYIPQGRRLFRELTVAENIEVGLMARPMSRAERAETRDWVLSLFPRLGERLGQMAGTLSGGEQQMLAAARALSLRPKVLMLDEPTEGLQPSMIALIRDVVAELRDQGFGILMVEQQVGAILDLADAVVFIENGRTIDTASPDALRADPAKIKTYLGV